MNDLQRFLNELRDPKVLEVEIQFVGFEVDTRSNITPGQIQGWSKFRFIARSSTSQIKGLVHAVAESTFARISHIPDIRYGVVARDSRGMVVTSLYMSELGVHGAFDGIFKGNAIKITGALPRWLISFAKRHFTE